MKLGRRTRISFLLVLAALAGMSGVLSAGCGACPFTPGGSTSGHECCRPEDGTAVIQGADCCGVLSPAKAAPVSSQVLVPLSASAAALTVPVELPSEPVAETSAAELHPSPPPFLHEGIGLYTLHAALLI